jgi:hypothetical protein
MPPPDVADPVVQTIAGVRLIAEGLQASQLPDSFSAFRQLADADLDCHVVCRGADPALDRLPAAPDRPWSFEVHDARCEVLRRNRAGECLWRLAAPLDFERVECSWSPRRFLAHYGSYERCWARALALVLLACRLRAAGGLVFHGMAADLDGHGLLCAGPSGRGKSTLARLLAGAGHPVLSDERPVVRLGRATRTAGAGPARVHGSPWHSSGGFAATGHVPLRCLAFIEHGEEDRLTPLAPRQALARLLDVAIIPWQNPLLFDPCIATLENLLASVPTAVLAFRPGAPVVDLLRRRVPALGVEAG